VCRPPPRSRPAPCDGDGRRQRGSAPLRLPHVSQQPLRAFWGGFTWTSLASAAAGGAPRASPCVGEGSDAPGVPHSAGVATAAQTPHVGSQRGQRVPGPLWGCARACGRSGRRPLMCACEWSMDRWRARRIPLRARTYCADQAVSTKVAPLNSLSLRLAPKNPLVPRLPGRHRGTGCTKTRGHERAFFTCAVRENPSDRVELLRGGRLGFTIHSSVPTAPKWCGHVPAVVPSVPESGLGHRRYPRRHEYRCAAGLTASVMDRERGLNINQSWNKWRATIGSSTERPAQCLGIIDSRTPSCWLRNAAHVTSSWRGVGPPARISTASRQAVTTKEDTCVMGGYYKQHRKNCWARHLPALPNQLTMRRDPAPWWPTAPRCRPCVQS